MKLDSIQRAGCWFVSSSTIISKKNEEYIESEGDEGDDSDKIDAFVDELLLLGITT